MSRQARNFETEPFLQHDMDRHNFVSSAATPIEKVYLNETQAQRAAREKKEQAEKDNCLTNCCNNLTLRDILLCTWLWRACNLDTDNCDCAPEKCCSGCGDACSYY